jgi:hypothetical protein
MGGCLSGRKFRGDPGSLDSGLRVTDMQSSNAKSNPKPVSKLRDYYIFHVSLSVNIIIYE